MGYLGDNENSKIAFEKCLSLDPSNFLCCLNYAITLASLEASKSDILNILAKYEAIYVNLSEAQKSRNKEAQDLCEQLKKSLEDQ